MQGVYAQYALATCSLTTLKPFSKVVGKVGLIPYKETSCSICRGGRSWASKPTVVVYTRQVCTGLIGVQLVKILGTTTLLTAQQQRSLVSECAQCECRDGLLYETSDTLGNNTESSTHAYGNCRERSTSPFRDHADRDFGSPVFLHTQCLLACRVKSIHIARFLFLCRRRPKTI